MAFINRPITVTRETEGDAPVFPVVGCQFPSAINPESVRIFNLSENIFWPQQSQIWRLKTRQQGVHENYPT